jgi:hypothetical protein
MLHFLLEKLDKLKSDRVTYCAEKALLFYELQIQGKTVETADMFKYNFFCTNTRKS